LRRRLVHSKALSFFLLVTPLPLRYTLFPYTTLFRSSVWTLTSNVSWLPSQRSLMSGRRRWIGSTPMIFMVLVSRFGSHQKIVDEDRKSTRLNSSHVKISYAVFCLKKKKNTYILT